MPPQLPSSVAGDQLTLRLVEEPSDGRALSRMRELVARDRARPRVVGERKWSEAEASVT